MSGRPRIMPRSRAMSPAPVTRPRRGRAFTLVEVMAALMVMAIVLPAVMEGVSLAAGLAGTARQRREATALAQRKLGDLTVQGSLNVGVDSGDFGSDSPAYRWESTINDWEEPDMLQVQVAVLWESRGMTRQVVLSTLVYNSAGVTP
jgi:general secretion pathway protein I